MADAEKRDNVIRGLEACQIEEDGCTTLCKANGCPYNASSTHCMTHLHKDALALLNEQEAVKPKLYTPENKTIWSSWFVCGVCGHPVELGDNFCEICGRPIKWKENSDE